MLCLILIDFDENRFDLDEYEQRLKKFEDYLMKREDEQKSQNAGASFNQGDSVSSMTLAIPQLSSQKKNSDAMEEESKSGFAIEKNTQSPKNNLVYEDNFSE